MTKLVFLYTAASCMAADFKKIYTFMNYLSENFTGSHDNYEKGRENTCLFSGICCRTVFSIYGIIVCRAISCARINGNGYGLYDAANYK